MNELLGACFERDANPNALGTNGYESFLLEIHRRFWAVEGAFNARFSRHRTS